MKYQDITSIIIGCAIKVHKHFGPGFQEKIYNRSLLIELKNSGLKCIAEVNAGVYYKEIIVGRRRLDILVEDVVLCELKAISELDKSCYNQILNYLRVFNLEIGLLINFGGEKLIFKRFINSNIRRSADGKDVTDGRG